MKSFSAHFERRLAPGAVYGLPLTVGLGVSLTALALFAALTVGILSGAVDGLDSAVAEEMKEHAHSHPELLALLRLLTHAGGISAMVALSAVGAALLWWRNYRLLALGWVIAAGGGGLFNIASKQVLDRDRPPEALRDAAVHETNKSFPSGHSMGSVIGYGMLGYVGVLLVRRRGERRVFLVCLVVLVLLIGLSRIYLRAHWLTDVLGGFAIGGFWVALCITWVEVMRRRLRLATAAAPVPPVSLPRGTRTDILPGGAARRTPEKG